MIKYPKKYLKNEDTHQKDFIEKISKMQDKECKKYLTEYYNDSRAYRFEMECKQLIENSKDNDKSELTERIKKYVEGLKIQDIVIMNIEDNLEIDKYKEKKISLIPFNDIVITAPIYFTSHEVLVEITSIFIKKMVDFIYVVADIKFPKNNYQSITVDYRLTEKSINKTPNENSKKLYSLSEGSVLDINDCDRKIINIIKYVSDKINTHEYRTYQKYVNRRLIEKKIVFSSEVKAHKRHFWEDTGFYKIPNMNKEELIENGYGVDELVFRDGDLRKNVPYLIIGQALRNKELKKENKYIDLTKKRIWKNQQKLGEIIREIFPEEYVKSGDRKSLKQGLELDFHIRNLKLAFEYDGEQHFDKELYKKLYGDGFEEQVRRDRKKDTFSKQLGIKLIRVKYDEALTISNIRRKIKNA